MAEPRIVIVGAGPAGVRAAEALVAAGVRPVVIDEGRRDGGQIYRRQPENFSRPYEKLYGAEAKRARAVHDSFDKLKDHIDYRPDTLVWNIAAGNIYTVRDGCSTALPYDGLILCTGATDRLLAVKGWELAGNYSLGGAQIALKAQACAIGRQVIFMGTGPLLYLVASQYVKAGAGVAAVLDTSPSTLRMKALPKLAAQPGVLWQGIALTLALRRAGVPVHHGVKPLEISGSAGQGVQGVVFRDAGGTMREIACDAVGMGYHLRPETQLADLARCEFRYDAIFRQWFPERDGDGRSSVEGVYLAGDGGAIRGARAAEASGMLAALALLKDQGLPVAGGAMAQQRRVLSRWSRFAEGLAEAFPWPADSAGTLPDETIVCRCEGISAGDLRHEVRDAGACEANRAKAFSRVGMGRCQGRYCGLTGAEVIAAEARLPVETVGRLRGQAPVKPLLITVEEA